MQSGVGFLPEIKTGRSGIDNFINCPFKMTNSYLKELTIEILKKEIRITKIFS